MWVVLLNIALVLMIPIGLGIASHSPLIGAAMMLGPFVFWCSCPR